MRLYAVYLFVVLSSIAAWISILLGWKPPYIAVWDDTAFGGVAAASAIAAMLAFTALDTVVHWHRWPKRLRRVPGSIGFFLLMMIWLAPLNLPAVPTMDGFLTTVAKDVAIAAAGGIVVGIALSFTSETDVGLLHTDPKKGHALILGTIALIAVVGVVFLYTRRS